VDAELKACFFAVFLSKIALKMAMARIKLLRNKKEAQVRQMRREVAQLLEANQDQTARIRVTPRFDHPPASSSLSPFTTPSADDRLQNSSSDW
jgi:hypothetical protein